MSSADLQPQLPTGPLLVVIPSVPAARRGEGFYLDEKAVKGLALYCQYWPGRVRCIFREGPSANIVFGNDYSAASLPFEVSTIGAGAQVPDHLIADASVVLASGDNYLDFSLAKRCRAHEIPLAYVIEYIPETRLQIIALSDAPVVKRLKSVVWTIQSEVRRRQAFKAATALQANGAPAAKWYRRASANVLPYFDTRLSGADVASEAEVSAKAARRAAGGALRLVFSGRLEKLKGADHLVPVAERLMSRGVDFRLDIFGVGSLADAIRERALRAGLADIVKVHEPLDFETQLVPRLRTEFDLFLCCHRQSDPSCTYMETLGCGVPIIGYDNRAFAGVLEVSDVGWLVPMGNLDAMARKIAELDAERDAISAKAATAIALASEHSFEATFERRTMHLQKISLGRRGVI
jgi:glycosyltransferase involved in cell wall biosynthesis